VNPTPDLSVVVAAYNKPEILRFLLAAYARQSFTDFEVIVADDGSGPAVRDVISEAERLYTYPVTHLWHEDRGWRKNVMLNNAIRTSRASHIVFTDGDCIPSRHFLLDHHHEREPSTALLGRRVETSERWSRMLSLERIRSGAFERYGWSEIRDGLEGKALRLEDGIRIPAAGIRRILRRNVRGMLGSNFSAAKADLVAVNGFDELYTGPGCGEDSDIQYRLSLLGVKGKSLRNLAIQYHVYHSLTRPSQECYDRFAAVQQQGQPRCRVGLEHL